MRTKYLLAAIITITASVSLKAQGVELPDFVITGTQTISIPSEKKIKPAIVTTLSREFLKPSYSPEEFSIASISSPVRPEISLYDKSLANNVFIEGGIGGYTLPRFTLHADRSFSDFLIKADAWGSVIKEYVKYSDRVDYGGSAGIETALASDGKFLPGLIIAGEGGFEEMRYKLYGSSTPGFKRNLYKGFGNIGFRYDQSSSVKFESYFAGDWLKFGENSLSQTLISNSNRFLFDISGVALEADAGFVNQSLSNNLSDKKGYFYFTGDFLARFDINENITLKAGFHHSGQSGSSITSPVGSISYKLNDRLSFFAEYSPNSEFLTLEDLISENRFFRLDSNDNIFLKNNHNLKGALKYEYDKFYEFSVGAGYTQIDNYPFFDDPNSNGDYFLRTTNGIRRFYIFGTASFHLGPFGYFYGDATYQNVDHSKIKTIPNVHPLIADFSYGYEFGFGLGFRSNLNIRYGAYTDSAKTNLLRTHINLSGMLYYELFSQFKLTGEIQNVLNRANYIWEKYQEKSFDVIFGIEYRF